MFGSPETTPGGRALKFYSSIRIDVRKGEAIKDGNEHVGNKTKCKVVKNKLAPPFKECEFDIIFGKGVSRTGEIIDLAVELDIIKKSGSWFSYKDTKIGQGRENAKEWLVNNPEISLEIEEAIKANASSIVMVSKKSKKEEKAKESAVLASVKKQLEMNKDEVIIDADDDFEEFTPVGED